MFCFCLLPVLRWLCRMGGYLFNFCPFFNAEVAYAKWLLVFSFNSFSNTEMATQNGWVFMSCFCLLSLLIWLCRMVGMSQFCPFPVLRWLMVYGYMSSYFLLSSALMATQNGWVFMSSSTKIAMQNGWVSVTILLFSSAEMASV